MNLTKLSKRGQQAGAVWGTISVVFALFVLVVFLFAFAIAGGSLQGTITNTTSTEYQVIDDGLSGMQAFSGLLTPVFVIAAIALLLAVLIGGVAVYIGMRQD
jgi:hypothetical protein